ncbi:type II toxin-antitoxin system VapC family toxin [Sphingomonas sp. RIT328]|uniref:type II toxin-antitoxin system VapC family toxin n=1 Tax=Sphingomonas sp. RIT328 TaxID=1470591 RepID=UPI000447F5A0|nr:type II toxin-antitoxin system VapC family toxin [Sphingomonas sp. RIT328]EZP53531.1 PIN domain protein [Sphingomonas sp. RIT328]
MKAVDTNIVVRYVTDDDPVQSPIATRVLSEPCYVSDTVLLETAWLRSSHYGFGRTLLAATLADLIRLPTITLSDPAWIAWAIERFVRGADLADMIHLVNARHMDAFISFEKRLGRLAGSKTPLPIERPS